MAVGSTGTSGFATTNDVVVVVVAVVASVPCNAAAAAAAAAVATALDCALALDGATGAVARWKEELDEVNDEEDEEDNCARYDEEDDDDDDDDDDNNNEEEVALEVEDADDGEYSMQVRLSTGFMPTLQPRHFPQGLRRCFERTFSALRMFSRVQAGWQRMVLMVA